MQLPRMNLALVAAVLLAAAPVRAAEGWPLPATNPAAAGFSPARLDTLHRNLRQAVDDGRYAGYITLLARDGQIVDWRAHGWQDVAARVPMQTDSIVRIYSMTKIVTTVAVLLCLEDGALKLSDPVEKFLPALANRKVVTGGTADAPVLADAVRSITVRDLLTHTAGYYYDEPWSAEALPIALMQRARVWEAGSLDEFIARLAQVPLHEQPGTRFRYGVSIDVLGAIVEKASGLRFDRFLQQRLFAPLDLRDTAFWVPAEKRARLALVHQRNASGQLVPATPLGGADPTPDSGLLSGGGGLYSTAADYARFAQMLLNGGRLGDVRILSRKTVELMRQNHIAHLADPHPFRTPWLGFGLGVRINTEPGAGPLLGSPGVFGWDGAATTLVQMDPQERTVALLLVQHFPYNQDDIFATFINGWNAALAD